MQNLQTTNERDMNAGLDFTIIVMDGLDLLKSKFAKHGFKNNVFVVLAKMDDPLEPVGNTSVKISAFRLEVDRTSGANMDNVQNLLMNIKQRLDKHGKKFSVNTFGDFTDYIPLRLVEDFHHETQ
jgi:hypothetical protein